MRSRCSSTSACTPHYASLRLLYRPSSSEPPPNTRASRPRCWPSPGSPSISSKKPSKPSSPISLPTTLTSRSSMAPKLSSSPVILARWSAWSPRFGLLKLNLGSINPKFHSANDGRFFRCGFYRSACRTIRRI
ncbi:hypothetical protein PGTUg99_026114 [Puccinia graminis f. sp. tritici]|uniref:Uncharacterized protein n=1 Tax=Puccinia graminis f. sp. tritici TaxID=56615 RepID=A0A5B0P2D5_PUCGR|nr:hypothetical protein PGTUg99_026114 [Puccinia graminis f. sp. tritici]